MATKITKAFTIPYGRINTHRLPFGLSQDRQARRSLSIPGWPPPQAKATRVAY